jgi:hypothetical protein
MRLPALLQTWAAWLALFPPEHAEPLGEMLVRLAPMLGPLHRHAARVAVEPAGVGDIVRRGAYEHLLASEWALADAVPDEFVRRAANGELLFLGPEPANSEQPLRSVALFDAGPSQLGEPRLAHMALFILLARRAELAGAEFLWGVLQEPGVLHRDQGREGILRLLASRSSVPAGADTAAAWDAALAPACEGGAGDCWLIGGPASPRPAHAAAHALVRRAWLGDALELVIGRHRRSRSLRLPLPAPEDGVRLLRSPFTPLPNPALPAPRAGAHSLKRPPMFSTHHGWLAVGMADDSVTFYHLLDAQHATPARPRNGGKLPHHYAIVAAGAFQKAFGSVALMGGKLHLSGFPGTFFYKGRNPAVELPGKDMFDATPGALRWAPAFHLLHRSSTGEGHHEQVIVLDKSRRLVSWVRKDSSAGRRNAATTFHLVATNVIGAVQHGDRLLFAVSLPGRADTYALRAGQTRPEHLYTMRHEGDRFLFGDLNGWRGAHGMYALRQPEGAWLVGDRHGDTQVKVEEGATVLGCARRTPGEEPGLVVLYAQRGVIALRHTRAQTMLADAHEPIAQASFDPALQRLAWLGKKSGVLTVRSLAGEPILRSLPGGPVNES